MNKSTPSDRIHLAQQAFSEALDQLSISGADCFADLSSARLNSISGSTTERVHEIRNDIAAHIAKLPDGRGLYRPDFESLCSILEKSGNTIEDVDLRIGIDEASLRIVSADFLGHDIRTIDDLSGMTSLRDLTLHGNYIQNTAALCHLTALETLDLSHNDIQRINTLHSLTSLTWLSLHCNNISSLRPLKKLTSLTGLTLDENNIEDISPVRNLIALKTLHLGKNKIREIDALENLTEVTKLDLSFNPVSNIDVLSNLSALEELDLCGNGTRNLDILRELPALQRLGLDLPQRIRFAGTVSELQERGVWIFPEIGFSDNRCHV